MRVAFFLVVLKEAPFDSVLVLCEGFLVKKKEERKRQREKKKRRRYCSACRSKPHSIPNVMNAFCESAFATPAHTRSERTAFFLFRAFRALFDALQGTARRGAGDFTLVLAAAIEFASFVCFFLFVFFLLSSRLF